jgi:DnaJ-class molecular chaperone
MIDDDDDDYEACSWCGGCGEGMYDGAACQKCHGTGIEPQEPETGLCYDID